MKNSKIAILLIASTVLLSCSKKTDSVPELPKIDGYSSANEVAASNLVAYWPLDGNATETKSKAEPSKSLNVNYIDGAKGKAANFTAGYLAYNEIAALNSLPSMSVSMWVNVKNNGANPSVFFTLSRPNEWAGNVNFMSETGWRKAASDTMTVKGLIVSKVNGSPSFQDTRNEANNGGVQAAKFAGTWVHLVMTWDGATSIFKVFANGVKISNPEWEPRGTTGPLVFTTPTRAIIGAWETNLNGNPEAWQLPLTGSVDEIRVYNKALAAGDISSLYNLEKAGQ